MTNLWTIALLVAISAARIGMGIFNSITGPTLLFLADNVQSSVRTLSTMFAGRSVGVLVGAVLGGSISRCVKPNFRHMFVIGRHPSSCNSSIYYKEQNLDC